MKRIKLEFYNLGYVITIGKNNKIRLYLEGCRMPLIRYLYHESFYNHFVDALSSEGYTFYISDDGIKALKIEG